MSKKEFKLPPLSPLIGSGLPNYSKVTRGNRIETKYWLKYILTGAIITILSPFRWYDKWVNRNVDKVKIKKPVFILGHWRSGTTHLHNILCQSPQAGFVTTYQTVFSNYLSSQAILKPFMGFLMPDKRPSDNVKLNVEFPQEEEFALSNMTYASYYHFFYFPEDTPEYFERYIAFNTNKKDIDSFRKNYKRLVRLAHENMPGTEYLVIKNPVNTGRYDMLNELYPDGKFIHIYRNPFIVFLSTKKFFNELMPTLWLQKFSEPQIEEIVLDNYIKIHELLYGSKSDFSQVYEIKFEDFEKDPMHYLEDMFEKLDIEGFDSSKNYFEDYINSKKTYRKNKYSISRREYNLVRDRWSSYLERWNYDLPDNLEIID